MIYGIERLEICGGQRREHHTEMAKKESATWPAANDLYREVFPLLNPEENYKRVHVSSQEAKQDLVAGNNVILNLRDGCRISVQEKFLTFSEDTLTIQVVNTEGQRGTWYSCTADFYLVTYSKAFPKNDELRSWILVSRGMLANDENLPWKRRKNIHDGLVEFDYLLFHEVPEAYIWTRSF